MTETKANNQAMTAVAFAVFAVVCVVAFLAYRGSDIGQLPALVGNLGGALFGSGIVDSLTGIVVALLIAIAWFEFGNYAARFIKVGKPDDHWTLRFAKNIVLGSVICSLLWFLFGILSGGYTTSSAAVLIFIEIALVFSVFRRIWGSILEGRVREESSVTAKTLIVLISIPLILTLIAALAPTTAKDSLLYHFALPKAFIAQGSSAFVDGNIASYLALGTEMHSVWAMLLGNIVSQRAGEAAAGATTFLFFPLLLMVVYGWARETGISRTWALTATAIVATVPSAYHVASSGYVDLSLALYMTLATYALTRWWKEQTTGWAILIAIFLGAALSVKLTAVFVFAAFALIILLRARGSKDTQAGSPHSGRIVATGFAALLLAGVIASPWYIRTWAATGSPIFPFYMSIWPGTANGWDVERSNLFQAMNSQYGGTDVDKVNYLTAPVRVSVAAQPEQPANYDGVLGVAFLLGLFLLVFGWTKDLGKYGSITFFLFVWVNLILLFQIVSGIQYVPLIVGSLTTSVLLAIFTGRNAKQEFLKVELRIMLGVAAVIYLFWLFSSEQLRYLLPIVPLLAIAIAASAEKIGGTISKVAKVSVVAASVCGLLTTFAWFCQKAPLRVVLGGETRDQYLTRNLDYYPYYQSINKETAADAKVWLINMRRDTYNIERPVFSDYMFEDWTLNKMLWESRSVEEMRAKAATLNVQYVLARHDFLFDYDRSTLVDDKRPRAENEAKLRIAKSFILDPARVVRADDKFSLVKVF